MRLLHIIYSQKKICYMELQSNITVDRRSFSNVLLILAVVD